MKKKLVVCAFVLCALLPSLSSAQSSNGAEKLGWKIGSQAYTFRLFTLEETLNKLQELGLKYVELYPGQKIGAGIEGTTSYKMDESTREQLKALLAEKGIQPVCYGVVSGSNQEEWEQIFEFAKALGIGVITTEPAFNQLDMVEKLCEKYQTKIAIHDHPIPSRYWHPDIILTLLKGRSPLMGACADVGHWVRSGLDPVKCLQKLEGRVISFHMKDMSDLNKRNAHDVPWGTGNTNIAGVLNEMKRQGFQGPISVEYEYHWENSIPEIAESLKYFHRVADRLAE